jgi:hypothetical protein
MYKEEQGEVLVQQVGPSYFKLEMEMDQGQGEHCDCLVVQEEHQDEGGT